jgi:large subunit ribosomal protein L3
MRQIMGFKQGMARVFRANGDIVPVTVIVAGPCPVVQVKDVAHDGYHALQIAVGEIRKTLVNRPMAGHFKSIEPKRHLREVRFAEAPEKAVGDVLTVDQFRPGDRVDVVGVSKGLGFQGAVRRHGFGGGSTTHGQSDRRRAPGSVGSSSYPSRVFRGQRMAGHMGNVRVTVRNMEVVDVRPEENLILLGGAVPGKCNALITIREIKKA